MKILYYISIIYLFSFILIDENFFLKKKKLNDFYLPF